MEVKILKKIILFDNSHILFIILSFILIQLYYIVNLLLYHIITYYLVHFYIVKHFILISRYFSIFEIIAINSSSG